MGRGGFGIADLASCLISEGVREVGKAACCAPYLLDARRLLDPSEAMSARRCRSICRRRPTASYGRRRGVVGVTVVTVVTRELVDWLRARAQGDVDWLRAQGGAHVLADG